MVDTGEDTTEAEEMAVAKDTLVGVRGLVSTEVAVELWNGESDTVVLAGTDGIAVWSAAEEAAVQGGAVLVTG